MPLLRPFRALRYDTSCAPEPGAVLCPPYDIIGDELQGELLRRSDRNAVRLELPSLQAGQAPDARYRDAARTFVAWRTDGTLRKDPQPHVYVHEMRYPAPNGTPRTARGFFCRLHLEPLTEGSRVRRHEHTMAGPKEDRLRLLRATGANLSPIVLLHSQPGTGGALDAISEHGPAVEATDHAGVRHRLWLDDDPGFATELTEALREAPLTIADGHHRYETALRYQEERGRARACESDPPYDYVLALIYSIDEAPMVLPTHRLLHDLVDDGPLLESAESLFGVERVTDREALLTAMAEPAPPAVARFGVWTRAGGALLTAPRDAPWITDHPELDAGLDVAILAVALQRLLNIDADALVEGTQVSYGKDAREAMAQVDAREADAAVILDPTPVREVLRVADEGGVMPQKSTYFYPKAPTGLVFNPLEA